VTTRRGFDRVGNRCGGCLSGKINKKSVGEVGGENGPSRDSFH
jgi:hypothetical protein